MKKDGISIKDKILWFLAVLIEWIIIPFYIAVIGYEINFSWFISFQNWEYIDTLYYILSGIDIALFSYFVLVYKIKKQEKLMQTSVFCAVVQIILVISKVKY